jgi:hypothetical protein
MTIMMNGRYYGVTALQHADDFRQLLSNLSVELFNLTYHLGLTGKSISKDHGDRIFFQKTMVY